MNTAIAGNTIAPLMNIIMLGLSPIPHHTQSGPKTVSESIIRLTVEDAVWLPYNDIAHDLTSMVDPLGCHDNKIR